MADQLSEYISHMLARNDYTWKLDGKDIRPDPDLIRKNLDGLKRMLYDEEPGTSVELGRLIVRKRATDKFDVYLMVGEDNDTGV